jgi:hypothetical protein
MFRLERCVAFDHPHRFFNPRSRKSDRESCNWAFRLHSSRHFCFLTGLLRIGPRDGRTDRQLCRFCSHEELGLFPSCPALALLAPRSVACLRGICREARWDCGGIDISQNFKTNVLDHLDPIWFNHIESLQLEQVPAVSHLVFQTLASFFTLVSLVYRFCRHSAVFQAALEVRESFISHAALLHQYHCKALLDDDPDAAFGRDFSSNWE